MFDALTKGFRAARQKLTGLAELTEDNIDQALRDVRLSLLEADVELGVVKKFLAHVREQTLGQGVQVAAAASGKRQRRDLARRSLRQDLPRRTLVRMMSAYERAEEILMALRKASRRS